MSDVESRWALKDMAQLSNSLTSAGVGIETIGRILNDTDLHADDANGLQQAIMALGDYVRRAGFEMHAHVDKLSGGIQ
ncbi:MAG TPA: hypothetical protein DHV63_06625 [Pseudomonas sp.]|nr:hypothetical protein [Pseudomonas sp.]